MRIAVLDTIVMHEMFWDLESFFIVAAAFGEKTCAMPQSLLIVASIWKPISQQGKAISQQGKAISQQWKAISQQWKAISQQWKAISSSFPWHFSQLAMLFFAIEEHQLSQLTMLFFRN